MLRVRVPASCTPTARGLASAGTNPAIQSKPGSMARAAPLSKLEGSSGTHEQQRFLIMTFEYC